MYGGGDGGRGLAGEAVLPHDDLAVLKPHAQVGAGIRHGHDNAPRLHHAGKHPHHGLKLAIEGKIAGSQDQVADARPGKIHINGHE